MIKSYQINRRVLVTESTSSFGDQCLMVFIDGNDAAMLTFPEGEWINPLTNEAFKLELKNLEAP